MAASKKNKDTKTINREAGDKQKGNRFQKLRAAIRMLEAVAANPNGQVLCAMEFLEDSVLYQGSADVEIDGEENKLYTSALSLNAAAVKNTIVAFLDLNFDFQQKASLSLGVYASAELANERLKAEDRERLGFKREQKDYSILKKIVNGEGLNDEEQAVAYHIALTEYMVQYPEGGDNPGYIKLLKGWGDKLFYDFLKGIKWSISTESNEELESLAIDKIRQCKFFNYRHESLEKFILSRLLDELEKRSVRSAGIDRFMTTDALRLIFMEVLGIDAMASKPADPIGDDFENCAPLSFRNLKDKIKAVSADFPEVAIARLARKCSLARADALSNPRENTALRRRLLDVCEDSKILQPVKEMTPDEVNSALNDLAVLAHLHMDVVQKTFSYRERDESMLKGTILTLFDDCFIAFDE